jgi:Oligosaccharyltransferase 48 kDa subunit beta
VSQTYAYAFGNTDVSLSGSKSGNEALARAVTGWTFQEDSVLRIDKVEHAIANTTLTKEQYTTNDQIVSVRAADHIHGANHLL